MNKNVLILAVILLMGAPAIGASQESGENERKAQVLEIPTQLAQMLESAKQKVSVKNLEAIVRCFENVTDKSQCAVVMQCFEKQYQICEWFFCNFHEIQIPQVRRIAKLNVRYCDSCNKMDETTSRAYIGATRLLDELHGWSFLELCSHISFLLKRADNVRRYKFMVMTKIESIQGQIMSGDLRKQKAWRNALDNIEEELGLFDSVALASNIKELARATLVDDSDVSKLETFFNDVDTYFKDNARFAEKFESHAHQLTTAYLRTFEGSVLINHICHTLRDKINGKGRRKRNGKKVSKKILYPFQLLIASAADDEVMRQTISRYLREVAIESTAIKSGTARMFSCAERLLKSNATLCRDAGRSSGMVKELTLGDPTEKIRSVQKNICSTIWQLQNAYVGGLFQLYVQSSEQKGKVATKAIKSLIEYYISLMPTNTFQRLSEEPIFPFSAIFYFVAVVNAGLLPSQEPIRLKAVEKPYDSLAERLYHLAGRIEDKNISIEKLSRHKDVRKIAQLIRPLITNVVTESISNVSEPKKLKKKKKSKHKRVVQSKKKGRERARKVVSKEHADVILKGSINFQKREVIAPADAAVDARDQLNEGVAPDAVVELQIAQKKASRIKRRKLLLSLQQLFAMTRRPNSQNYPEVQIHEIGADRCLHWRRDFSTNPEIVTVYLMSELGVEEPCLIPATDDLPKMADFSGRKWDIHHSFPREVDLLVPYFARRVEHDDELAGQLGLELNYRQHALAIRTKMVWGRQDPGLISRPSELERKCQPQHDGYIVYGIDSITGRCFHRMFHHFIPA